MVTFLRFLGLQNRFVAGGRVTIGTIRTLGGRCPSTVYSLICASPLRLLVTAELTTRYASTEIGVIAPSLFSEFGATRSFTSSAPRRITRCVGDYKLCGAGSGSVIRVTEVLYSSFNNIIPSGVSSLAGLPKVNEGATGLIYNSVFNRPTIIISARYVHVAGELKLRSLGSRGGVRFTLHRLLPPSRDGSFYRQLILRNETIYATEGTGYRRYYVGKFYPGGV